MTIENPSALWIEITPRGVVIKERVDLTPAKTTLNIKTASFMKEQTVQERVCTPPCDPK